MCTPILPGLPPLPDPLPLLSTASSSSSSAVPPPPPQPPQRKIFTSQDLAAWGRSEAREYVERVVLRLVAAVKGKGRAREGASTEEEEGGSEAIELLVEFLDKAREGIAAVPLDAAPQRFGNKAFRVWVERVSSALPALLDALLARSPLPRETAALLAPELKLHLLSSLGSAPRLDFGTGHELSFVFFLCALFRAGVLRSSPEEERSVVERVFRAYVRAVHEAQRVFRLEPAGSKGVWGLDDHMHLVYLFGASQLVDHPSLRPSFLLTPPSSLPPLSSSLASSSLLPLALTHLHTLKRGPFAEHSPLLHQIGSTIPSFAKVTKGLWEMYRVEVLGKVPVVQHCRFGLGMAWVDKGTGEGLPSSGDGRDEADADGEEDDGAALGGPVITPAPWASPASSSSAAATPVRPLPPPLRLSSSSSSSHGPLTTASHAALSFSHPFSASSAFAKRQHPLSFPVPPSSSSSAFKPPPFFPPRRTTHTAAGDGQETGAGTGTGTVGEQGGAAAASSPFGVLPRAELGARSSSALSEGKA
ncbi:hypothetical protein JCM10207_003813 [Rhodosporidiobolus poonsookiae]